VMITTGATKAPVAPPRFVDGAAVVDDNST
jgi:hypothetical protein